MNKIALLLVVWGAALCLLTGPVGAQYSGTVRDVPLTGTTGPVTGGGSYHPEYQALLGELRRLQARMNQADAASAAAGRQALDAAANRLRVYIDSGKPTLPAAPPPRPGSSVGGTVAPVGMPPSGGYSRQGSTGPGRIQGAECRVSFQFYEVIDSEGMSFTGGRDLSLGCGGYALHWQGDGFSIQHQETMPRDDQGGGWNRDSVSIQGRLSPDHRRLERIEFEKTVAGETEELGRYLSVEQVVLVDIPRQQLRKIAGGEVYTFQVKGGDVVSSHVQQFQKRDEDHSTAATLKWRVGDDERVLGGRIEPGITITLYRPAT